MCVGGGYGADSSDVGACDCPLLLSVLEVSSDLSFHPLILFLIGSARRKLTCTICNRKCSSSLNLQEHRKVRLHNIYCSAQMIPNAYSASDPRGFTQLTQFCMIHFCTKKKKKNKSPFFGCFLLYSGIHHTLPGTQPNLLISQSSPLPELPCSLCSVIPCPREGVFMIKWLQIYSG